MTENQPPLETDRLHEPAVPDSPDIAAFLHDVQNPSPDWAQPYGGPDGVIAAASNVQRCLSELSNLVAAVRSAAIREQLTEDSGAALSRRHNISAQAISQAARASRVWKDEIW